MPSRFIPARILTQSVPALAWFGVLILGAWLAAGWYWRLAAPAVSGAMHMPLADAAKAGTEIVSRHLFGALQTNKPQSGEAPVASHAIRIVGVMTGSGHSPGFAVIQDEGKSNRAVIEGEEIVAGIKLERVLPQGVEISRNGQRETLALDSNTGGALPAVPTLTQPQQVPLAQPAMPPATNPQPESLSRKGFLSRQRENDALPTEHAHNE